MSESVADKMKLRVVLLDETLGWAPAIRAKAGRIFAAYLLDAGRSTNCVEITPSYELKYLYCTSTKGAEDVDLQETLLSEGAGEGFKYVHCSVIDRLPQSRVHVCDGLPFAQAGLEEYTYEELFEKCAEYFTGNVAVDLPRGEPGIYQVNAEQAASSPDAGGEEVQPRRGARP